MVSLNVLGGGGRALENFPLSKWAVGETSSRTYEMDERRFPENRFV